jgi:hypothetical protein
VQYPAAGVQTGCPSSMDCIASHHGTIAVQKGFFLHSILTIADHRIGTNRKGAFVASPQCADNLELLVSLELKRSSEAQWGFVLPACND